METERFNTAVEYLTAVSNAAKARQALQENEEKASRLLKEFPWLGSLKGLLSKRKKKNTEESGCKPKKDDKKDKDDEDDDQENKRRKTGKKTLERLANRVPKKSDQITKVVSTGGGAMIVQAQLEQLSVCE
jgi:hypothetical protein